MTEGYYKRTVDNTEALDQARSAHDSETELTMLMTRGVINQNQYLEEQQRIRVEMQGIQRKLQEERSYLVQGSDFHPIKEFDEEKLYKFIKRVVVKDWTIMFEFFNGVCITRSYTNGQPGNIKDWKLKQKQRREEQNG